MRADIRARRDVFFAAIGKTPLVMGVLNLTPDSFSDGGLYCSPDAAFARARQLADEGCAIVDVGAESTRPEAAQISDVEEARRLSPAWAASLLEPLTTTGAPSAIDPSAVR